MPQESNGPPLRIAVLTDGRAANRAQALGLAQALAARLPARVEAATWAPPHLLDRLPSALLARLPLAPPAVAADLAIGAGRRGNLAAALLRRRGVRAVAVLDPHLPHRCFDAVVLPEHDGPAPPGTLRTLGALHGLSAAGIAAAPRPFPDLPGPRLAVLLGGPSRSARFGAAEAEALLADLARFRGWSLLATASRRTPQALLPRLRAAIPALWLWDGTGPNPYPGLLAVADAVLVTADSVSMASEAAATGRPVFVSGLAGAGPKQAAFHAALAARGIARPAAAGPADWRYPPLDEAGRMAGMLITRFGFAGGAAAPI